jgi:hypothetical protein
MTKQVQVVEESKAVAVWSGMELKLADGRTIPFLFCSDDLSSSGFFVEDAKPSSEDEDRVRCPHCRAPHYVVSLPDAMDEGLIELGEAGPGIVLDELLAVLVRRGTGAGEWGNQ